MNDASAYGVWSLVMVNSLMFIMSAFNFARPQSGRDWRSFGVDRSRGLRDRCLLTVRPIRADSRFCRDIRSNDYNNEVPDLSRHRFDTSAWLAL
jgi:hypothetical protein